ncbi:MAG: HAMP domain-containing histidine kinase [Clostridia bacterium]|nr:HAMP domain-containing histidine kinase [Clostridia bacterium]
MMGRSLRWRLFFSYVMLTVLILTMLSMTFFHLYSDTLIDSQRQLMYRDVSFLTGFDITRKDGDLTEKIQHENFAYVAHRYDGAVWLLDMDGTGVELDSEDSEIKEIVLSKEQLQHVMEVYREDENLDLQVFFDDEVISEAMPIVNPETGEHSGILVLHMRTRLLDDRLHAVHNNVLYAGFVALLFSVALMLVYAKGIIRPLKKISDACRRARKGDFSGRVEVQRNDEIGQMAQSFNAMISRLDDVEQSRQRFIADVSHELRTPLTTVQGYLQGISDGVISEDERDRYLGIVQNEVRHMSDLVQDLLQMSHFTTGQIRLQCCKMDLCDLIGRVLIHLESRIKEKNLHIIVEFNRDEQYIFADPMRMEQVFTNLIDNAIKFTDDGGHITIKMYTLAGTLRVQVTDDGKGMSPEQCEYIFDRFYKADNARTPGGGYGLGLSIVWQIMVLHKALIEVDSKEGKGTTFTLVFPSDMVM